MQPQHTNQQPVYAQTEKNFKFNLCKRINSKRRNAQPREHKQNDKERDERGQKVTMYHLFELNESVC